MLAILGVCLAGAVEAQSCTAGVNASLTFDGQDDWVRVPDHPALDGFADFTVEFWMQTPLGLNQGLVNKYRHASPSNADDAFSLRVFPPGVVRVQLAAGATTSGPIDGGVIVADGHWHHVALTRSGTSVSVFVDGIPDLTFSFAGVLNATTTPLAFGALLDAADSPLRFLGGRIDEIRIWNVHRTSLEIQQGMLAGLLGTESGLVGYWRLDEASGQIVGDSSGSGAIGSLGFDGSSSGDDPAWAVAFPTPLSYCGAIGGGQANTPEATLLIDGVGSAPAAGPFSVTVAPTSPVQFLFRGTPGASLALLAGPLNQGVNIPGFGILSVGSPPMFTDLLILLNGFDFPGNLLFQVGPAGEFQFTVTSPAVPPGTLVHLQGVLELPNGLMRPTAAFRIVTQ